MGEALLKKCFIFFSYNKNLDMATIIFFLKLTHKIREFFFKVFSFFFFL